MSQARKVLLLLENGAVPHDTEALDHALRGHGAAVRRMTLAPPYDGLLDALADGWLPVLLGAPPEAPMPTGP
ncbi:MAG: hypothetical protein JNL85_16330 [Rubrivivax sp.]|nr:hypothetical protein [Rubrivivax sp.]